MFLILGSLTQAATLVEIDLPEISLQQAFTSVTVPDGGTVLLGGFRSLDERKYESFVPIIGRLPLIKNIFRRKAYLNEKRSLYILLSGPDHRLDTGRPGTRREFVGGEKCSVDVEEDRPER